MTIFLVRRMRQVAELGDMKATPREYTSRDRIMSREARTRGVEPDLKPLDP